PYLPTAIFLRRYLSKFSPTNWPTSGGRGKPPPELLKERSHPRAPCRESGFKLRNCVGFEVFSRRVECRLGCGDCHDDPDRDVRLKLLLCVLPAGMEQDASFRRQLCDLQWNLCRHV